MLLFTETERRLALDVLHTDVAGKRKSVLPTGPKELQLKPTDSERPVTLFFHTAASFRTGEVLDLDIRDLETSEQFPPGGIKLTVGRDM